MITIKKLKTLPPRTRLRKIAYCFHDYLDYPSTWLYEALEVALSTYNELDLVNAPLTSLINKAQEGFNNTLCQDLCYEILHQLGAEPADWDFKTEDKLDSKARSIHDFTLILDRVRSPFNVGSIFRSADSFGVKQIILVEGTASPLHPRALRTSRGTHETVSWCFKTEEEVITQLKNTEDSIMALELGGTNINEFNFPSRGFAIIGSEEFGVSPQLLSLVNNRVSIPTSGSKGSLNVSVATGIFLNYWFCSQN